MPGTDHVHDGKCCGHPIEASTKETSTDEYNLDLEPTGKNVKGHGEGNPPNVNSFSNNKSAPLGSNPGGPGGATGSSPVGPGTPNPTPVAPPNVNPFSDNRSAPGMNSGGSGLGSPAYSGPGTSNIPEYRNNPLAQAFFSFTPQAEMKVPLPSQAASASANSASANSAAAYVASTSTSQGWSAAPAPPPQPAASAPSVQSPPSSWQTSSQTSSQSQSPSPQAPRADFSPPTFPTAPRPSSGEAVVNTPNGSAERAMQSAAAAQVRELATAAPVGPAQRPAALQASGTPPERESASANGFGTTERRGSEPRKPAPEATAEAPSTAKTRGFIGWAREMPDPSSPTRHTPAAAAPAPAPPAPTRVVGLESGVASTPYTTTGSNFTAAPPSPAATQSSRGYSRSVESSPPQRAAPPSPPPQPLTAQRSGASTAASPPVSPSAAVAIPLQPITPPTASPIGQATLRVVPPQQPRPSTPLNTLERRFERPVAPTSHTTTSAPASARRTEPTLGGRADRFSQTAAINQGESRKVQPSERAQVARERAAERAQQNKQQREQRREIGQRRETGRMQQELLARVQRLVGRIANQAGDNLVRLMQLEAATRILETITDLGDEAVESTSRGVRTSLSGRIRRRRTTGKRGREKDLQEGEKRQKKRGTKSAASAKGSSAGPASADAAAAVPIAQAGLAMGGGPSTSLDIFQLREADGNAGADGDADACPNEAAHQPYAASS